MTNDKASAPLNYYWCLEHHQVEQSVGCGSTTRIGPYATAAEAATALSRTRQREAEQKRRDEQDKK